MTNFSARPGRAAAGPGAPVKVWLCSNDELPPEMAQVLAPHWLDEHEQEIAGRFLFERDRRQYLVAHALVRRVLAVETGLSEPEIDIWRSSHGRPYLQTPEGGLPRGGRQLDFNLSHAHGYNLLGVVRDRRIGVDIERLDRSEQALETVVRTFLPQEQEWVAAAPRGRPRDRRALRLWTLKEAYSKARGLGLGLPFDTFSFRLADDRGVRSFSGPPDDRDGRWRFVEMEPVPEVVAAVAVQADASQDPVLLLHHGFPWGRATPRGIVLPPPVGGRDDLARAGREGSWG